MRLGANVIITKPFSPRGLLARILTVLRRAENAPVSLATKISFNNGDLIIDFDEKTVQKKIDAIRLTHNEFKLLSSLISYPEKVFSREELIEIVFGSNSRGCDRTIDSHIKNIRQTIEDDLKTPHYILPWIWL